MKRTTGNPAQCASEEVRVVTHTTPCVDATHVRADCGGCAREFVLPIEPAMDATGAGYEVVRIPPHRVIAQLELVLPAHVEVAP